jgi:DHA1 family bicyclomycin/chloramphenicol resistance-like MFS transporter
MALSAARRTLLSDTAGPMSPPAPLSHTPQTSGAALAPWVIVAALSMLLGLQPLTTDLYLPALPQMQRALGASPSSVQWTLSVLILSFGVGQLVWGPVADRFGRQPVLRWGLGLYVLASALAAVASDLHLMIAARAAQGACLSAAVVCGRAMVRDLYVPEQGARMMAKGMSGLGVIALVGPIAGGMVATYVGWRAVMALLAALGLLIWAFVWWRLPETLPPARRQQRLHWGTMVKQWWGIAGHRSFQAHALLTSSTYGGLYAYLALSAFVFIDVLGVSRNRYGLIMASISLSYLAGTFLCRKMLPRYGLTGTIRLGGWVSLAGGLGMAAVSAAHVAFDWAVPAWSLLPGMWLYGFAHGIHQPCGQTGVVAAFPRQAGAASALAGFVLSAIAFAVGSLLSWWSGLPGWSGTIHPMTLGMGLGGALTAWVALGRVQRDGVADAAA